MNQDGKKNEKKKKTEIELICIVERIVGTGHGVVIGSSRSGDGPAAGSVDDAGALGQRSEGAVQPAQSAAASRPPAARPRLRRSPAAARSAARRPLRRPLRVRHRRDSLHRRSPSAPRQGRPPFIYCTDSHHTIVQ